MKNSNDTIGNRNRDLPACSAVPQPTAPPPAPGLYSNIEYYTKNIHQIKKAPRSREYSSVSANDGNISATRVLKSRASTVVSSIETLPSGAVYMLHEYKIIPN